MLIGLAAAAPLGPVNLVVLRRALSHGSRQALAIGAGAALGDALFAAVAAFGLAALATAMDSHAAWLRLAGGIAMLAFAVALWRSSPRIGTDALAPPLLRTALLLWTLTVTNPATLLFFASGVAATGVAGMGHATGAAIVNSTLLVAGAFAGSMLWWAIVCLIARRLRGRVTDRHLRRINHATAIVLAAFGAGAIAAAVAAGARAAGWI